MSATEHKVQRNNISLDVKTSRKLSDIDIKVTKAKIKKLVTHLVERHIANGGMYFESSDAELYQDHAAALKLADSHPKTIASQITPYLMWITSRYISKFYKLDAQNFCVFTKTTTSAQADFYHLDYSVTPLTHSNLSILMMFMVVAFEDHFSSTEINKVVLNRLCYLVNQKA